MDDLDIKQLRKKLKMTQEQFGGLIGVSRNTIINYEKGEVIPAPKIVMINNIVKNFEEEHKAEDKFENSNGNSFLQLPNGQYLMTMPLAEFDVQAGFLDYYTDLDALTEMSQHAIIVDKPAKGRYIAFRVKGDSMDNDSNNSIPPNSIVSTRELLRHLWQNSKLHLKNFEFWVIYTTQSRYPLLKQIIDHDVEKGIIKCHSLNEGPEYQDFELNIEDIQALFYVVSVTKGVGKKDMY